MTSEFPNYPHQRIGTLDALARVLAVPKDQLLTVASRAEVLYRIAAQEQKADGSIRQTFDAKPKLKEIQRKIKERLLQKVKFPPYLQGSLKGRSPRLNAESHKGAHLSISEDIQNFFPSVGRDHVVSIWRDFFRFSDEVSELLTALTVKDDGIPQGAITSSYMANLVFWDYEPRLVEQLAAMGLTYTRYVDDVIVSSRQHVTKEVQSLVVAKIYGMLGRYSLRPKRTKHEVSTRSKRMTATKLVINKRVALPKETRQNIRAQVFAIERRVLEGDRGADLVKALASASSRVGRLASMHPTMGQALKARLKVVRTTLASESPPEAFQVAVVSRAPQSVDEDFVPPWV
ncbi:RNA-directed DNA polymerase [Herbaspirillum seropedicae]|uniref:Retron reverse transcriptase protein n=1 Tax=Herbaspirillum seropedicae (strain SmR1) TaxID=757424 RepID=D8IZQ3_HERSS|nr:reverse transcriptase family protein [Herbaspirillum seropedicae]ADJ64393.1 retron reverse transcriptase protein [Herbaspirillum seropedicae SmR1]AKN66325.1 hypothetical protein ACP92_14550 [Herbaspirillum seropedicae]UMU22318.1 RNA-directed DNA polymerase [Herbaspirillum seropedicae]